MPGRLVHDEEVLVLVGERDGHGPGLDGPLAPGSRTSTTEAVSSRWLFGLPAPSTSHGACGEEPFGDRP